MCPRSGFSYRGTSACTLVPVCGTREHPNVPSFRFLVPGNIGQNHPFGNHPFANPRFLLGGSEMKRFSFPAVHHFCCRAPGSADRLAQLLTRLEAKKLRSKYNAKMPKLLAMSNPTCYSELTTIRIIAISTANPCVLQPLIAM